MYGVLNIQNRAENPYLLLGFLKGMKWNLNLGMSQKLYL
jgi:hypothetical protein